MRLVRAVVAKNSKMLWRQRVLLRGLSTVRHHTPRVCKQRRLTYDSLTTLLNWEDSRDAWPSTQVCDYAHASTRGAGATTQHL